VKGSADSVLPRISPSGTAPGRSYHCKRHPVHAGGHSPAAARSGNIQVSVAITWLPAPIPQGDRGRECVAAFETTGAAAPPAVTITTSALVVDPKPVLTGTSSLSAGAPVVITIDTDNNGTTDLTYFATVQAGGIWSLDIDSATPTSGTLPAAGLSPFAKVTATATNAYGNSSSVTGLNIPT